MRVSSARSSPGSIAELSHRRGRRRHGLQQPSSLAEIEPDYLKFDNVFVRGIDRRKVKQDLLEALLSFARKMKTKVIAEGIETREELKVLQSLGVPYGQGFLLARPMPIADIEMLRQ